MNNKPKIRFKGFSEEWIKNKIGNFTQKYVNINKENNGTLKSYSVTNKKGFVLQNKLFENGGKAVNGDKSKSNKIVNGIFAYNPSRINVGSISFWNKDEEILISPFYETFSINYDFDKNLFLMWLKSNLFNKIMSKNLQGGVRLGLKYSSLSDIYYCYSHVTEQQKIGSLFQNIDILLKNTEQKTQKIQSVKNFLLQKMFPENNKKIPEIRFKGFSEEWHKKTIKDIFSFERPDNYIVKNEIEINKTKTPVLTANKSFILGYTFENRTYKNDSIIFDDFTKDFKYVNFEYMVKSSAIKILTSSNPKEFVLEFLHSLLFTIKTDTLLHGRHWISVIQPSFCKIPKYNEQQKIGSFFQKLDRLIQLYEIKQQKQEAIKKALLEKMFI
ncbi:hypothetical protein [[Mycoplasma] gypis]|uniref:Restriction endonuclease subunit S n=1 Tax=[Mycoplasma] gypis TaxID=92404 RepID=A0ABZ2RNY0_9BACT|nr:hypothetical protein [[Mycoplasma] gypis]MBN0919121.1 hypothetical protein [[Mycoplasma] gypis]